MKTSQNTAPKTALLRRQEAGPSGVTRIASGQPDPIVFELRRLYDDAATEPLPDRLIDLLDQLERLESSENGG